MVSYDFHSYNLNDALEQLDIVISVARKSSDKFINLIVGYGSSGKTHKIRTAIIEILEDYKKKNRIRAFLLGEHMNSFDGEYVEYLKVATALNIDKNGPNKGSIYLLV